MNVIIAKMDTSLLIFIKIKTNILIITVVSNLRIRRNISKTICKSKMTIASIKRTIKIIKINKNKTEKITFIARYTNKAKLNIKKD